jgi:hypothetical protein
VERRLLDGLDEDALHTVRDGSDPDELLHPAQAFEHPSHVGNDPDLTPMKTRHSGFVGVARWRPLRICAAPRTGSNRFYATM